MCRMQRGQATDCEPRGRASYTLQLQAVHWGLPCTHGLVGLKASPGPWAALSSLLDYHKQAKACTTYTVLFAMPPPPLPPLPVKAKPRVRKSCKPSTNNSFLLAYVYTYPRLHTKTKFNAYGSTTKKNDGFINSSNDFESGSMTTSSKLHSHLMTHIFAIRDRIPFTAHWTSFSFRRNLN